MVMMKVFLVLYQFSPVAAGFGDALSAIVSSSPRRRHVIKQLRSSTALGRDQTFVTRLAPHNSGRNARQQTHGN
jgi:hypothetical protein